jgi:hypothetical protein
MNASRATKIAFSMKLVVVVAAAAGLGLLALKILEPLVRAFGG